MLLRRVHNSTHKQLQTKSWPTLRCLCLCLGHGLCLCHCLCCRQRRDATNWQRVGKQGGAAAACSALIKHSRLSLARPPAGEQHQQQLASKMDDAVDAVCVRASECARALARVRNKDGSMRTALSVTNVPLFCFIVS
ncbi:hypothetical protein ACLKA6_003530 [Drosophila palustris]